METARSNLDVRGRPGTLIEKKWLLYFWILFSIKLLVIVFIAVQPVPPEYDLAPYILARVVPYTCWVGLVGTIIYCTGYREGGVKMLWAFQVVSVLAIMSSIRQTFVPDTTWLLVVVWFVEMAPTVPFLIWNGYLVALNTKAKKLRLASGATDSSLTEGSYR